MSDQLHTIVSSMMAAGESEADIAAVIQRLSADAPDPAVSHGDAPAARPIATGGGRGTGLDVRKSDAWAKDNAPAIGATLATAATGGAGLIPSLMLAGGGGYLGARARGDARGDAAVEGITQAGMQGAGEAVGLIARPIARGLMKGTIPKNIGKEFHGEVDIPREMLDRGAFPGVPASAKRIEGLSTAANAERDAAALTVPNMPRRKVIAGLRPIHAEATLAKEPEIANDMLQYMRKTARNVGPEGLTGPEALARKTVKQRQGKAALTAGNSSEAAVMPQIANAERKAIASHLRETPRMGEALGDSQALMAIDQVMQDAAHSNPVTRMRIGGLPAAAASPLGLGATAHAVNQLPKVMSPQVLRALAMMKLLQDEE